MVLHHVLDACHQMYHPATSDDVDVDTCKMDAKGLE